MTESTVLFYPKCYKCGKVSISYLITDLNEVSYNAFCRRCIPSGINNIDRLEECTLCEDNKNNEVFAKLDNDNFCLKHFVKCYSDRRHSLLIN